MTDIQKFKLSEFQCDSELGLHRLVKNYRHLEEKYKYSDGAIENYILSSIKNTRDISDGSDELMQKSKDWASYYHLGIGRSNIIRCLDLPTNSRVLELGSGCGAISQYLGEEFESVDCVEGSLLRAKITRERCRDLNNVTVFCSDIKHLELEPIYDVVTLIGVLEYAPVYFSNCENPFNHFLEIAKSALKPNGTLIIAIENKIGIKYWSGCPEDHTGIIYDSINGYPKKGTPRTFSKKELVELLGNIGLRESNFYYCNQDYKFATVIFSDVGDEKELYLHNWIDIPFTSYSRRKYSFHEGLALRTLSNAGLLREFANSFLILASRNSFPEPDWVAKKFTINRFKKDRCITTLKLKPTPHVEKLKLFCDYEKLTGCSNEENETLKVSHKQESSPWYKGDLMIFDIYEAFNHDNHEKRIMEIIEEYYNELIKRFYTGKDDEDGIPLLEGCSLDFILRNVIRNENGELIPIDLEWHVEKDIPADYVVYRCISIDVVGLAQQSLNDKKITNPGNFTLKVLKSLFPNYKTRRYSINVKMEKEFSNRISGELNAKRYYDFGTFPTIGGDSIWKIARIAWPRLPYYMQNLIKYILIKIK